MKKSILTLFFLMTATLVMAQETTANGLIKTYKGKTGAEYVHIPKTLMKLGYLAAKNDADDAKERQQAAIIKKIDNITILSLEDCDAKTRQQFARDAAKLKLTGYEELIKANDEGEKVTIYLRQKGDSIRELLLLAIDGDDTALIQINGNIKPEDIQTLVNMDFD